MSTPRDLGEPAQRSGAEAGPLEVLTRPPKPFVLLR